MKNMFCSLETLHNESDVEQFFVIRLLKQLGYKDESIRTKASLKDIIIGRGSKKENYKPDYVLLDSDNAPILILDAKSPSENPIDYHYQVSAYALHLNQAYKEKNPVRYTAITNGHYLYVWPWDNDQPVFYLRFEDFQSDNTNYLELYANIGYGAFKQVAITKDIFEFEKPELTKLIKVFNDCHNLIRKKDSLSPTDAFYEFSKLMFIKIREDNKIHEFLKSGRILNESDFVFSVDWIDTQTSVEPNPINSILFRQTQEDLEREIRAGTKKRIFAEREGLNLKAETIREVVGRLQHYDLYGIDEDLNGRMFETFLNATVRGKDLGQFFTPRGIVHYMVETAALGVEHNKKNAISENIPYVLDGCCGSGGFLIDTMCELTKKIMGLSQLTNKEKEAYLDELRKNHLWGIDSAEKIARISRLNMYLHGDGGSKIFKVNSLDKPLRTDPGMNDEERAGVLELRKKLIDENFKFDTVLTNPPFSISYKSNNEDEKEILKLYELAKTSSGDLSTSEQSNVLFIERYNNLLKEGSGELLTIIDDTVLNGENSQKYREYILNNFIIIQVVSLPFNAFFRADANIKTSMIHLRKKKPDEEQGSIFMAITNNIGHDDHSHDTPERNNLLIVLDFFKNWQRRGSIETQVINNEHPDEPLGCPLQIFEVKPNEINIKRLDAFYYAPELKKIRKDLKKLEDDGKIFLRKGADFSIIDTLKTRDIDLMLGKKFKYFEIGDVTIDGTIVNYREDYFEKLPTRGRLKVQKGDIIFAKNNSSRGTTVLIPEWYDSNLVTTGFIGIRPQNHEDALILWSVLEADFFRKQIYYLSITASQPEVRENIFREEMLIPWPKSEDDRRRIVDNVKLVDDAKNQLKQALNKAKEDAQKILA
jgi:type I restriction enzyme M protein